MNSSHRPQILIVDDDQDVLTTLAEHFRLGGFEPLVARDGIEALEVLGRHPGCRRVLTDYTMPGLGAEDWLAILRERMAGGQVVVMSEYDVDPGIFIISPKPLDIENLLQHFHRVALDRPVPVRVARRAAS